MHRFSTSWSKTLRKLGFNPSRKRRMQASRRCRVEVVEARQMLTYLIYLGEDPSDCPDDCPCECAQVGTTKGGAATTSAGNLQYSSQTQSHPVLMFGLEATSFDITTKVKARLTVGNNAPIDAWFGPNPEAVETQMAVFGIQIDASSMSSGVYDWQVEFWLYREGGNFYYTSWESDSTSSNLRPLHVANRDQGQYGVGWSMLDDARLMIQESLSGHPDGVVLVTGSNDVTWFRNPDIEGVYTREENPNNFSELQKDDNGTTSIETDDTYILTDPYGTVTTFDYHGLQQTIVDRNGNALATYTYGTGADADKIVDIEDEAGRHTHFQYDAGLLVEVTDFHGTSGAQITQYDYYSGTERLYHMTEPDPDGTGPLTSPVTTYHYNGLGLLDSVTDPRGLVTTVTYDQTRRVSSITERCGGVTNITSLQSLVTVDLATNGPDEVDWAELHTWLPRDGYLSDADIEAAFAGDTYETRNVFGTETKIIRDRFGNINYEQDANGTITKYRRNYLSDGLLNQVTQPNPNDPSGTLITTYGYDASGRLSSILYPNESYQLWDYDSFGQVESYIDGEGLDPTHFVLYDLDDDTGNVESMSQWTGDEYLVTTYTYTDGTGTTPIKGLPETITDPNGNETHYTYNSQGLVETIVYAEGTDEEITEHYEYDDRDRLAEFTDGRGNTTLYHYDNLDRLTERIEPDADGVGYPTNPTWLFSYDPNGNQTRVIDPDENVTQYVYDERNRVMQVLHPVADPNVSPQVKNKADSTGAFNVGSWAQISRSGSISGNVSHTSDTGGEVEYEFTELDADKKYMVLVRWTPSGTPDEYDKNALFEVFGNTASDPLNSWRVNLNAMPPQEASTGLLWLTLGAFSPHSNTLTVSLSDDDDNGRLVIDHLRLIEVGPVSQSEYDCNGNLVQAIDPLGNVTEFEYDDLNRLIARKDPDPDTGDITANSPVTSYAYNALGWLTSTTDPNEDMTFYEYDAMGRRTKEASDALFATQVTTWTYDLVGRVTEITDPNGNTTEYEYDQVDRVTSESITIDGVPRTRSYVYIPIDNVVQKTDRNGRVTTYEYDHLNRLKYEKWYTDQAALDTNPGSPLETINYYYDENSNLLAVIDPSATYAYVYDYLNRQTDLSHDIAGLTPRIDFERHYDAVSRMTTSAAAIGATADYLNTYTYDAVGRVTRLTQAGQSGGNAVANKRVDFAYNGASQVTALSRYASLNTASPVADTDYGYAGAGRLTSIAPDSTAPGSTFAETHSYTYDGANRLTSYANVFGGVDAEYAYDPTDQLTGVDYATLADESYAYDANGNRQSAGGATYSVGPYNRLLSDGVYDYEYDDEGNLTQRRETNDPGNLTYYTWDHRNRLIHVSGVIGDHEFVTVDYAYDAFNQLVYEHTNRPFDGDETLTVFVHDNGQIVLQFNKVGDGNAVAGDLSHRYLWGDAVDQLFADEQVDWGDTDADGEVLWALTDHLGSVRDVVDSNGKHRIHRNFDAFGNIVDESHYDANENFVTAGQPGYVDEAFAFTGRYFDKDTGLQNNLNRWYDPTTGRWLSEDPIGFDAGDANLYRYVGNSPTMFIDPSGLIRKVGGFIGGDYYIKTRDGKVYVGSTGNDLIESCSSIRDAGQIIDSMIIKGHGGGGDPSSSNDGPWMQSSDGHTMIGIAKWRIYSDNSRGYRRDITDTLKDITDQNTSISLRGCSTSTLGGVISGRTQAKVTANPVPVVNVPFTWWYIGPWLNL